MRAHEIYTKETGKSPFKSDISIENVDIEYIKFLEELAERRYEPTILKWIKKMFDHAEKKQWFETYFCFDIHGTISIPDYRKSNKEIEYYPYAKETLQLMSERDDIVMIISTSSYPEEIEIYNEQFKKDGIIFRYVNENPEISSDKGSFGYYKDKFYFNVLLEDKSGFNPLRDWEFLYSYFKNTPYRPDPRWDMKYKEEYHKD